MSGATIHVTIDDSQVKKLLDDLKNRTQHLKPVMNIIGTFVRKSIQKNFEEGGRPIPWKPSKRVLLKGGKTLILNRQLFNSFTINPTDTFVEVGTNKKYAAVHQFGEDIDVPAHNRKLFFKNFKSGKRKGRTYFSKEGKASYGKSVEIEGYKVHIDARPFMMVQDDDWPNIAEKLNNYIIGIN